MSRQFPRSVKLAYEQAVQQSLRRKNKDIADDNSSEENNDDCLSTEDDLLINTFTNLSTNSMTEDGQKFNQGINYGWSDRRLVRHRCL